MAYCVPHNVVRYYKLVSGEVAAGWLSAIQFMYAITTLWMTIVSPSHYSHTILLPLSHHSPTIICHHYIINFSPFFTIHLIMQYTT